MVTRLCLLLALVPAAGCVGTAVDILERTDAEAGTEAEAEAEAEADSATDDGREDGPAVDGDAGSCRPGVPGACRSGELCDVHGCDAGTTGTCVAAPSACAAGSDPVCGCDGATYWNDCERVLHEAAWSADGACAGATCVPLVDTCPTGQVCAWTGCFSPTASTCIVRPSTCASSGAPMCGCDGITYGNPCAALAGGFPIDHTGECSACTPKCMTVTGGDLVWLNPCTGDTFCTVDCSGCTATCLALGWYAFCLTDLTRDAGCGLLPGVIGLASCGT